MSINIPADCLPSALSGFNNTYVRSRDVISKLAPNVQFFFFFQSTAALHDWFTARAGTMRAWMAFVKKRFLPLGVIVCLLYILSGFDERYLQKLRVRFNNLTLEVNKKQLKVAS